MERQERRSRIFLLLAFLLTLISLGLLAAAMGSEYWVQAAMRYKDPAAMNLNGDSVTVSYAHHGLFGGELRHEARVIRIRQDIAIRCDASARTCRYNSVDPATGQVALTEGLNNMSFSEYCDPSLQYSGSLLKPGEISFWSWIVVVIFLSLAMLFGLVAAVFTMVNVLYVPISDFVGIAGVYVWNIAAAISTLITLCVWAGLYYTHLRYNILPSLILSSNFLTSCGMAQHGVAVWLCLAALLLFFANVVLVRLRRGGRGLIARNKKSAFGRKEYRKGEETLY